MHSRPSDDLYVRWTQVGVFSSHMRYHGGTPREPWTFPAVSGIVRQWLRFRYALLPYILDQAQECCRSGLPMLRSLVIDWPGDPAAWSITDEYLFGDAFLVCPVLSETQERDVYLPEGEWVDFWGGRSLKGPLHLHQVPAPLSRIPLYVRRGRRVEFADPVQHTGQLPQARRFSIWFDEEYPGYPASDLKDLFDL
jgi:alpha-D-xyloside xylohydrolase